MKNVIRDLQQLSEDFHITVGRYTPKMLARSFEDQKLKYMIELLAAKGSHKCTAPIRFIVFETCSIFQQVSLRSRAIHSA